MTLGHVYDMDLKRNESLIKEVIIQAQGEVNFAQNLVFAYLTAPSDGSRRIHQAGQGNLDELYFGFGELPNQVSPNQVRS
jgi:hypothetical protein